MEKAIRYYQDLLLMSFSFERIFEIIERDEDEFKEGLINFFKDFQKKVEGK